MSRLAIRLLEDVPLEMIESQIGETLHLALAGEYVPCLIVGAERIGGEPHMLVEAPSEWGALLAPREPLRAPRSARGGSVMDLAHRVLRGAQRALKRLKDGARSGPRKP